MSRGRRVDAGVRAQRPRQPVGEAIAEESRRRSPRPGHAAPRRGSRPSSSGSQRTTSRAPGSSRRRVEKWRLTSSAAGPERPKCVHRSDPATVAALAARARAHLQRGGNAQPAERADEVAFGERRGARGPERCAGVSVCPRALASAYPPPSEPVFGRLRPPVASTTRGDRIAWPAGDVSTKPSASRADRRHAPRVAQLDAGLPRGREQRIEHGARAIGHREQLARLLALERDAELAEERDRARHVEAAQHLADGRGRGAVEGPLVHGVMGDVAPPAAGDEDLRAQRARAVEDEDAPSGAERAAQSAAMSPAAPAPTTTRSASGRGHGVGRRGGLSDPRRSPARATWSDASLPLRSSRSIDASVQRPASGSVARMRSSRRPSFLGNESMR